MKQYNLIFVSTHQKNDNIISLINSINVNIQNFKVLLIVVSQDCRIDFKTVSPCLTLIFINEHKMSLSAARNIGLKYLLDNNISADYIMFPDDDSSFDHHFFENFPKILNSNKSFITPIYNAGTMELYFGKFLKENTHVDENMHFMIGSPNQVIEYNRYKNDIHFNEDLGVGSKYGSCEDYDLFIRLNRSGAKFFYTTLLHSFHPSKVIITKLPIKEIRKRYKSYSPGFVFIMRKYGKFQFVPYFLARPLGAIVIKIMLFDFRMAAVFFEVFFFRIKLLVKTNLHK